MKTLFAKLALPLFMVVALLPLRAFAAYAFITSHQASSSGATTTVALTISAGQALIIFGADGGASAATLTVTDTLGNTFTSREVKSDTFNSETYALFDCLTPTTGSDTITLTSSAASNPGLQVLVYTGIASYDQSTAKFAHSGWSTATNGAQSTAITPTSQPGMLIGLATGIGGTIAPDAGANSRVNDTTWINLQNTVIEDYRFTSTASANANFTFSLATASNVILAGTYLESGGSSCTNNFWSSTGAWAIPNGTTGSYWSTTGVFSTPDCSTGSYWLKSGAKGAN